MTEEIIEVCVATGELDAFLHYFSGVRHARTVDVEQDLFFHFLPDKVFVCFFALTDFLFLLWGEMWYWQMIVLSGFGEEVDSCLACQSWYFTNWSCHNDV